MRHGGTGMLAADDGASDRGQFRRNGRHAISSLAHLAALLARVLQVHTMSLFKQGGPTASRRVGVGATEMMVEVPGSAWAALWLPSRRLAGPVTSSSRVSGPTRRDIGAC